MPKLELLSVVALLQDLPDQGLVRGQIGTIVEVYTRTEVEVEFCDKDGRTYALEPLKADQIILLHDHPLYQVAWQI